MKFKSKQSTSRVAVSRNKSASLQPVLTIVIAAISAAAAVLAL